jgi:hypothetical protein
MTPATLPQIAHLGASAEAAPAAKEAVAEKVVEST